MVTDVDAPPEAWRVLDEFTLASEPGNERAALARVAEAVTGLGLPADTLDRLKTAVAETTMNAIEHGNGNRAEVPVEITVTANRQQLVVEISDQGGEHFVPQPAPAPDLDAKLAGLQTSRGWGLFLIRHMVDAIDVATDGPRHTVRLQINLGAAAAAGSGADTEGESDAQQV